MSTPPESRVSLPWKNRFQKPSAEALLAPLPADARGVITHAREAFNALTGSKESLEWTGPAWRWSWLCTLPGKQGGRVWIVPDPAAILLIVELDAASLEKANGKKAPRHVRDAVAGSTPVGPNRWCQWAPTNPGEVDEIVAAIRACIAP
ncbi:MAG: hypothetical protein AB7Q00_11445 [Phycisphaerales bacterium]